MKWKDCRTDSGLHDRCNLYIWKKKFSKIFTTFFPPQLPLPHRGKVDPDRSITHSWEIVMKFIKSRWSGKILFPAFVLCLNVCTNRSAARFVGGWYGAQQLCFTPLITKKLWHTGISEILRGKQFTQLLNYISAVYWCNGVSGGAFLTSWRVHLWPLQESSCYSFHSCISWEILV